MKLPFRSSAEQTDAGRPGNQAVDRSSQPYQYWGWTLGLAAVAGGFVLWKAWVSDDAFITFRHVENLLAGYGPVFNPGERVQGFSHPLWFLLLSAGSMVLGVYAVAVLLGLALTMALFALQAWLFSAERERFTQYLFVAIVLLSSKTFVEFQTSGLETSLSSFLVASLWGWMAYRTLAGRQPPLAGAVWLSAAIVLTRPDHLFLVGPILVGLGIHLVRSRSDTAASPPKRSAPDTRHGEIPLQQDHRRAEDTGPEASRTRCWKVALAAASVLGWYGFATIYYGTPLPNTAYAKVIGSVGERLPMGLHYIADYAGHEPVHAAAILLVLIAGGVVGVRRWPARTPGTNMLPWLVLGVFAHLGYLACVGGDFMRGRFMDPVLVASTVLGGWLLGPLLARLQGLRGAAVLVAVTGGLILLVQIGSPGAVRSIDIGFERIRDAALMHRAATVAAVLVIGMSLLLILRQMTGRESGVFLAVFVVLAILLVGYLGYRQPGWAAFASLTAGAVAVSIAAVAGWTGQGFRRAGSAGLACLVIAGAASLCDVGRRSESGEAAITDDYSFYRIHGWHNPFRHPVAVLRGSAGSWRRLGLAAREYAGQFGPITLACRSLGITSYYAGPRVHVIDLYGLTDPYLNRGRFPPGGRSGHIPFAIPAGYLESRGAINLLPDWYNRLQRLDPTLAAGAHRLRTSATWDQPQDQARWETTCLVTAGPLLAPSRFTALPGYAWPRRDRTADPTACLRAVESLAPPFR